MEKEAFFTGYCRQLDGARTVCAEAEDGELAQVDCCYPNCEYISGCPVAKEIQKFVKD